MIEVETHGQQLTDEFLDELFVSIRDRIPDRQWVEIRKNHEQVVAGVKHMIDCACFGADFELVFNKDYTHFKKRIKEKSRRKVYENKFVNPSIFSREDDILRDKQEKEKLHGSTRKNSKARARTKFN